MATSQQKYTRQDGWTSNWNTSHKTPKLAAWPTKITVTKHCPLMHVMMRLHPVNNINSACRPSTLEYAVLTQGHGLYLWIVSKKTYLVHR